MRELLAFSPELLVTLAALGLVCFDAVWPTHKAGVRWFALVSVVAAMGLSAWVMTQGEWLYGLYFHDALKVDQLTSYARLLFGFAGSLVILASWDFYAARSVAEYFALFLFSLVGEVMIVSGQSLLMLFIGIELLAIPTYVLVALLKEQAMAIEAGLKYFLLGMFASVVMLYGVALLYGAFGTVGYVQPLFTDPRALAPAARSLVLFGFFFLMMGVGFKIVAFPFHFWSPDVYAGGSTPVVAYISTVPKVAIVLALFRLLGPSFTAMYPTARWYLAALCVASVIYGNIVALMQSDVRRLLAYSGVANTGYMLIALTAGGSRSFGALLLFLVLYTFTNLGAFFVVLAVSGQETATMDDFSGLSKREPFLAFAMAVFMFSLAGTPPLAGFFGKLGLFRSAVEQGLWPLALVGLLASVVSVGYYLRVAQAMYGGEPALATAPGADLARIRYDLPLRIALGVTLAATLALGVAAVGWFPVVAG